MYNKRFCKEPENIENYEAAKKDNFTGWQCHHRLETHTSDGERRLVDITPAELKALGMYWYRPASELIFLPTSEHRSLHNSGSGNPMCNEDTRKKMSETKKGKCTGENNAMYGKHHTEESKKKMSLSKKGKYTGEDNPFYGKTHSDETRMRLSAAHKGKRLSKEHINKVAEANRGKHWYNNGKETKFCFDCPPGFAPGRLRK